MNEASYPGDNQYHTSRRHFLTATSAIGIGMLTGCGGDGNDTSGDSSDGEGGNTEMATTEQGNGGETGDGASGDMSTGTSPDGSDGNSMDEAPADTAAGSGADGSWRQTELTDVRSDQTFSIDGLEGPVAIQSFAVWCPKCERQSEQLSKVDESVTVVSLNTDPNEEAAKVREHAESNEFDWRFAVAPTEMTESLIDEFGTTVTNAPSTPIIVACDDEVAEFFSGSQQSAKQIESAASEC